jgi:hypothetical protein
MVRRSCIDAEKVQPNLHTSSVNSFKPQVILIGLSLDGSKLDTLTHTQLCDEERQLITRSIIIHVDLSVSISP